MALTYAQALEYLASRAAHGMKPGLQRTEALLHALGDPHVGHRGALVAGTNGKGSVCAMVDAACRAAGLRSLLLTKPHLTSYRERFVINGELISPDEFAHVVDSVIPAVEKVTLQLEAPTQFEVLTVMGMVAAQRYTPDVVICEVGLGGRLDSTNVFDPGVAVITNVALDHEQYLGDTVELIAREKAAIIKPGNHVVIGASGAAWQEIVTYAQSIGAATISALGKGISMSTTAIHDDGIDVDITTPCGSMATHVALSGSFQAFNAAVAAGACCALAERGMDITLEHFSQGCAQVWWPGRLQRVSGTPELLLDGAHNPAAAAAIVDGVRALQHGRRLVILFAAMQDKDIIGMAEALRPLDASVVTTQVVSERAADAATLAEIWGPPAQAVSTVDDAFNTARSIAGADGMVLICGSLYLVGDVLRLVGAGFE